MLQGNGGCCVACGENESHQCITDNEQFKVVRVNKDVLYTKPCYDEHDKR